MVQRYDRWPEPHRNSLRFGSRLTVGTYITTTVTRHSLPKCTPYQVAAEQDVESGQLSDGCPVENRGPALALKRPLKRRPRDTVEADVEDEKPVLKQQLLQRSQVRFRIIRADAETGFRLDAEQAGAQQLARAGKDVLFEALNVHFEEIRFRNRPFVEQRIELSDLNPARFLVP